MIIYIRIFPTKELKMTSIVCYDLMEMIGDIYKENKQRKISEFWKNDCMEQLKEIGDFVLADEDSWTPEDKDDPSAWILDVDNGYYDCFFQAVEWSNQDYEPIEL